MKKSYQKPNMLVVELRTNQLMATSTLGFGSGTKSGNVAAGNEYDEDFEDEDAWW